MDQPTQNYPCPHRTEPARLRAYNSGTAMTKTTLLLAIFLASLSLSDTALASHKGREECLLICLNAYNKQTQACNSGRREDRQSCNGGVNDFNLECRRECYRQHPDLPD
jgi:hypothetical protein